MNRRIVTRSDLLAMQPAPLDTAKGPIDKAAEAAPAPALPKPQNYETRVLMLIPADVVAVFVAVDGGVRASGGSVPPLAYAILILVIAVTTYFYVLRQAKVDGLPPARSQALLSGISFLVWVFAIGGPFAYAQAAPFSYEWLDWYGPLWGTILLPVYTLVAPMLLDR
jgi:hypothetical protein